MVLGFSDLVASILVSGVASNRFYSWEEDGILPIGYPEACGGVVGLL